MNAIPRQAWAPVRYEQTAFGATSAQGVAIPGGLDLTTPTLRLQPGALRDCLNFECAPYGGYARVGGYERVDGRAAPSDASYTIVQVGVDDFSSDFDSDFGGISFTNIPSVGQVVTQAVSGATGTIIAVVSAPVSYIAVTKVTGIFDTIHQLTTPGPVIIGNAGPITISLTAKTKAIYLAAAADVYRALIAAVPGSGAVRGVVAMAFAGVDHLYAFRDNIGGTAVAIYKATATGWVSVPFYDTVSFTAGTTGPPADGETLTQGGVTATIKRVVWQSGAWAGSAAGRFIITVPAGGSFAAGAATTTSGSAVTLSGAEAVITMLPGGRFEFDKGNFSGQLITRRIYGCDGVNSAFEFDGDVLVPIATGASPNMPTHIRIHKSILFLSQAASLLGSAAGFPFKWSAVDGAIEIATGDTVTGMITLPGDQTTAAMAVALHTNTAILYGTDPTTFNFVTFNNGVGAVPFSIQNLFDTFFLDNLGALTFKTSLNFGNFVPSTLTQNILPFIARQRGNLLASSVNRAKSQYRLFFNDGYALFLTMINQQNVGPGLVLYAMVVNCADTTTLTNGNEALYVGATDGFVYQLDKGTSFDGNVITAYFVTAWNAIRTPRILKRFRAASLEVQGDSYAEISYGYQLGYDSTQIAQIPAVPAPLNFGAIPHWDEFVWDAFVWDGTGLTPTDVDETGTAENIRMTIGSGTNYTASFTVSSVIHHYSLRRGMRV